IVTVHVVAVTLAQPVNVTPRLALPGVAVRITVWPAAKLAAQVDGQSMPSTSLSTVPEPDRVTVSLNFEKVAVTVLAALMVTLHCVPPGPPVEPQPVQPPKPEPVSGVAVTVTGVLGGKSWKQSVPQLKPGPSTVPAPPPTLTLFTVSRRLVNVAVTVRATLIDTVQTLPLVEAQPAHEVNAELALAVGVSSTVVPGSN